MCLMPFTRQKGFIALLPVLLLALVTLSVQSFLHSATRNELKLSAGLLSRERIKNSALPSLIETKPQLKVQSSNTSLFLATHIHPLNEQHTQLLSREADHALPGLPRWTLLYQKATQEGCHFTDAPTASTLRYCLAKHAAVIFIDADAALNLPPLNTALYLVSSGKLQLSLAEYSNLAVIAAESIELRGPLCRPDTASQLMLYSAKGAISLPEGSVLCQAQCRIQLAATNGLAIGGESLASWPVCPTRLWLADGLDPWQQTKAAGRLFSP